MCEVKFRHLSIAYEYFCGVTTAPSKIKHPSAGQCVIAARTIREGNVAISFHGTPAYQYLSLRQSTQKVYGEKVLKMDVALLSKYALQFRIQWRRFEQILEGLENGKAVCCFPAPFFACELTDDCRYDKGDKEYSLREKKYLSNTCLPHLTFQQKKVF